MTEYEVVNIKTKIPYGARVTLKYAGTTYVGTCVGIEVGDPSFLNYLILKFDDDNDHSRHGAVNDRGEIFTKKCWWIEYGARILNIEMPFEPAGISELL